MNRLSTTAEFSNSPKTSKKPHRWLRRLLWVTLFSTASVAGLLYTSKYFRDLLSDCYPPAKSMLNKVGSFAGGWYEEKPKRSLTSAISDFPPFVSQPKEDIVSSQKSPGLPSLEDVMQMTRERSQAVEAGTTASLDQCIAAASHAVQSAIQSLSTLETTTRNYIEGLREAIKTTNIDDESGFVVKSSVNEKKWDRMSKLASIKEKAEVKANEAVAHAMDALDALHSTVNQYKLNENSLENEAIPEGISIHGKLHYDLSGSICEVRKLQNESQMLMRYRDLVSKTHETIRKDLDLIREHTDLDKASKDGSPLTVDELNSLIVVAHNRISQLQTIVAEAEEKEKARLNSALEAQRRADEEMIADHVKRELELERNKHQLEQYRWAREAHEATQRELRLALARHSEHLSHMLRLKQEEMEHQFTYRLREKLAQEKVNFEAALSGWIQRMRAIEDVVDGRAELDRISKETQSLWIACEALVCSLSSTSPTVSEMPNHVTCNTTGPLRDFVDAVREAASTGHHPFVLAILEEVPPEVSRTGVWSEHGLKERFEKVYKVCRRVALVDETSASLSTYALSWLQSILIFDVFAQNYLKRIPWLKSTATPLLASDSELGDSQLDTFCLLRSAKAALTVQNNRVVTKDDYNEVDCIAVNEATGPDDGIELAVRLLGQLRGQARLVASDWINDARVYLETKQAARALLAYAVGRGISTFQKRL